MLDNFQDDINKSFCLMQDLMELLQVSSCNSTFDFLDEILDDLGNTVKFFRWVFFYLILEYSRFTIFFFSCRQTWMNSTEPESHRNYYILLLSIICKMASLRGAPHIPRKSYDPTEFTSFSINSSRSEHHQNTTATMSTSSVAAEHSVWLQQLEIACYDYSIEQFYSEMHTQMSSIVQVCVQAIFPCNSFFNLCFFSVRLICSETMQFGIGECCGLAKKIIYWIW